MGHYTSVRGWLECDEGQIPEMRAIVQSYRESNSSLYSPQQSRDLYQMGWRFPLGHINWTSYVFYGADIRSYWLDFIKDQLEEMVRIDQEIVGYFHVDDEEGDKLFWCIGEGKIVENTRK